MLLNFATYNINVPKNISGMLFFTAFNFDPSDCKTFAGIYALTGS